MLGGQSILERLDGGRRADAAEGVYGGHGDGGVFVGEALDDEGGASRIAPRAEGADGALQLDAGEVW